MNSTKEKKKEHTAHTLFYLLRELTRKQTNLKVFFFPKKQNKTNSSITTGINTQPKISHNSLTGIFNDKLKSLRL